MKRGASHVDWVISMGIFLVYVVALFVFLRPGVTVEHKPLAMLDLLENNIKNEVYVNLKETPVHVESCWYKKDPVTGTPQGDSTLTIRDDNSAWDFVKVEPSGYRWSTGGSSAELKCGVDNQIESPGIDFYLSYLPKIKTGKPSLSLECDGTCEAELRATENSDFVYELWLDNVKQYWLDEPGLDDSLVYDKIKEKFGFPEVKDFIIKVKKDTSNEYVLIGSSEPKPEQANIYIIEWKDSYIDSAGNVAGEIIVHIEVW